jgi:hypothetical protein
MTMMSLLYAATGEHAQAVGENSTILLSRPSGLGALPETGENSAVVGRG